MYKQVAILIDGGFIRYQLSQKLKRYPTSSDIEKYAHEILTREGMPKEGVDLFRIFYYDCYPSSGKRPHPVSGETYHFAKSLSYDRSFALLEELSRKSHFALRKGELNYQGWKLNKSTASKIYKGEQEITPDDVIPDFKQKGVDMKIGLDMALLAVKKLVNMVVLVTGDSDFVPAMKLARKEGLKVYLDRMGKHVTNDMIIHSDVVLPDVDFIGVERPAPDS